MNFETLLDNIDELIEGYLNGAQEVLSEDLGLDRRAAYRLYVTDDAIVVNKGDDRSLQYYGGFEYVDSECRKELGNWVFYSAEDDRVAGHLDRYKEKI